MEAQTKVPAPSLISHGFRRGTETILLFEDNPALREMAATLLTRRGDAVSAAANGMKPWN